MVRRDLLNQLTEAKGNIRVLARVRPLHESEDASPLDCGDEWTIHAPLTSLPTATSQSTPALTSSLSAPSLSAMLSSSGSSTTPAASTHAQASSAASLLNKKYQFDRVFGPEATQKDVFGEVETLSTSLLDGFNCCLFAYGQTGSGKTFTMEGPASDRGLNYRLLQNVFSEIQERSSTTHYDLNVSIMEIYNEAIVDLLDEKNISSSMASISSSANGAGLKMRQGERGIFVPDATRMKVTTIEQVEEAMEIGKRVRAVASTDMNEHSSRSHCITCIEVCGRKSGSPSTTKTGETASISKSSQSASTNSKSASDSEGGVDVVTWSRLFLIDLAGSERVAQSGAQGKALDEARHINKSLSALARVMECLQMKRQHIPFRDSTLTYLLKDSLVEAKTVMVLNLSPAHVSYGQTMNSLNFGVRVRKIERSAPKKNFDLDRDRYNAKNVEMETELKTLRSDVNRLNAQLNQAKLDSHAEIQAMQTKHTDVVSQLRIQATQTAQAHSAEIAALMAAHAQEVAALKKSLADANANAAKLAEIQKKALAAVGTKPAPAVAATTAVIASTIISQNMPPQQPLSLSGKSIASQRPTMASKENMASALNDVVLTSQPKSSIFGEDSKRVDDSTSKSNAKYMHASTPLKPKSITALIATAPIPVTPKSKPSATVASPSKLASPKVVVDELQRMYLQQLSQITSPAMTGPIVGPPSSVPTMGANGVLQPVVLLTPQMARTKPITIANASSPLPFDMGLAAVLNTAPIRESTASIVKHEASSSILPAILPVSTKSVDESLAVLETSMPASALAPCILDDDSYLTTSKAPSAIDEVEAVVAAPLQSAEVFIAPTASIAPLPALNASTTSSSATSSSSSSTIAPATLPTTATVQTQLPKSGKTWPHRGCLLNKHAPDRTKKSVTFCEQDEFFESGDPLLPIRRLLTSSGTLMVPKPVSTATSTSTAASRAHTVSPASPIKSVAVRPTMTSAGPGARRVVAKSTTTGSSSLSMGFSTSAPKPTPGRVRPVGRVAQPLAGPSSVYKTY